MVQENKVEDSTLFKNIVIEVQGVLFNVPLSAFRRSSVFRDMLALPPPLGIITDGSDDSNPLVLEGIELEAFRPFMRAAIASEALDCDLPPRLTVTEICSVYALARQWDMGELLAKTVEHVRKTLNKDNAAEVAKMAIDIDNDELLYSSIELLILRKSSLSITEMETLGMRLSKSIFDLQTQNRSTTQSSYWQEKTKEWKQTITEHRGRAYRDESYADGDGDKVLGGLLENMDPQAMPEYDRLTTRMDLMISILAQKTLRIHHQVSDEKTRS